MRPILETPRSYRQEVGYSDSHAEWYDLAAGIGEARNLAERQPETVAALQKELDTWNASLVEPKWPKPAPAKKK